MLSRPSLHEVRDWRQSVDQALEDALPNLPAETLGLVELGIQHEQQHQELLLTDILATFAENPLEPAYGQIEPAPCHAIEPTTWIGGREGLVEIGRRALVSPSTASGRVTGRCSTRPHRQPLRHQRRWADFIADGGYSTPTLWLSEGWTGPAGRD